MLKLFKVKNFKGFKNEFILDLSKTKEYEFNQEIIKNEICNKAMIYGENGSGKSNLGFALFDIICNLTDKQKLSRIYNHYSNADNPKDQLIDFFYEFKFGDNIVSYSYRKKSFDEIVCEELKINGEIVLFYNKLSGEEAQFLLKGTETLNIDIKSLKISIVRYVNNNSILEDNEVNKIFKTFIKFVENMLFFRSLQENNYIGFKTGSESISKLILEKNNLKKLETFLNKANIECKLIEIEIDGKREIAFDFDTHSISFYEIASSGTRSLTLLFYWIQMMDEISFAYIDEFDAFYHNNLSKLIVKELRSKDTQIILTTHNTSIMNNDLYRPDCYFKLMKNEVIPLCDLTSKVLRKANNLEKLERAGAFNG